MKEDTFNLEINKDLNSESRLSIQNGSNSWHGHGSNSWHGRGSISLSHDVATRLVDEIESERAAEAGDDGGRHSLHGSARREISGNILELGLRGIGVVPNDALIYCYPFQYSQGDFPSTTTSAVSPLPSDIISPPISNHPLSTQGGENVGKKHQTTQVNQQEVNQQQCPNIIEYILILAHLAIFGIFGVLIRHALEVLFGPDVANVTNDHSALYIDLPSNMVGSFFMGWVSVVFKSNISLFSEALAIGLSTGLMGSITTFSSWIQNMVNLTTEGHWMMGIIGLLLGMELAQMSLVLGVESTKLAIYIHSQFGNKRPNLMLIPSRNYYQHRSYGFIMCMVIIAILWGGSLVLSIFDFKSQHKTKIWIACLVAPCGVWVRWYLARLNGQGIGSQKRLKWLPVGTLLTNLIATMLMATLSTIQLVVKDHNAKIIIEGLQVGFLGCMSTVSTFVVEVQAMHQSTHTWRAYVYILSTLFPAFVLGTLIYSIPVWTRGFSQT